MPKRAFGPEQLEQIRNLLSSGVQVREQPRKLGSLGRMIALWAVLIVVFLAAWQLLNPPR